MTQMIVDTEMSSRLDQCDEPVELVDPRGRVLGTFRPPVDRSLYRDLQPPLSIDELRRRAHQPNGYTTDEVLRHLEGL